MQEKYQLKFDGSISSFNPALKMSEFGINFETIEQARKAEKAFNEYYMLYKLAEELNPIGWEPDWKTEVFAIEFDHNEDCFSILHDDNHFQLIGGIYFASAEIAEKALDIFRSKVTRI